MGTPGRTPRRTPGSSSNLLLVGCCYRSRGRGGTSSKGLPFSKHEKPSSFFLGLMVSLNLGRDTLLTERHHDDFLGDSWHKGRQQLGMGALRPGEETGGVSDTC